ncbi:HAUS augmin-like complex subunit 8 [Pseudophryne corroboree]|uniref:HAUS augmin-like complex subunit 8 n=1 Tax=Pseudophryne corroboree TaxID=495146 RepID=UPI003081E01D
MAEAGSGSLELGSQNSSEGSSGDAATKKKKVTTVIKSRYLQYDKPKVAKKPQNVANTTVSSAGKVPERGGSGTPTRRSVVPQRQKAPVPPNVADGSLFWKDDLQSTLLDGHKIARPELDFSVINEKTMQKLTPKSLSTSEQRKPKRECALTVNIPEDVTDMYESQTLLLTYLTVKMQKNMKRLEEKAEHNLFLANEEKNQLQEKVYKLRRDLLLNQREEQLHNLLEKQAETLAPSSAAMEQFKDNYTSFATAVDCTRHQLPIKDIHVIGTRQKYLEEIQKPLSATKCLLEETMSCSTDVNVVDLCSTIKNLQDTVLKTDGELSRSSRQVLDLSFKVNKEIALQSQKLLEENCEVEVVRQWYFDQADI